MQEDERMPELQVLEYLKKEGPSNTFKLARALRIDRGHLLDVINRLEAQGALTVKSGVVHFLKFLPEEVKEVQKEVSQVKKLVKADTSEVLKILQSENKKLKEKLAELEETIKRLEKRASALPKAITKTIIKRIPVIKTVIKKVPVPSPLPQKKKKGMKKARKKTKQKTNTRGKRRFPVSRKSKISARFRLPKFKFMKGIKRLKTPEFAK